MILREFLLRKRNFAWGGVAGEDCMTLCATWIQEATGVDVVPHLRGLYSDAIGAERLIVRSGGMIALAANLLESRGFLRTETPADGDVGIVLAPAGFAGSEVSIRQIAAIRFGKLWAAMGQGGVIVKSAECVAAWKINQ